MQIILRSKKEIHYATEIEKILKAMYPKFAIKVKIFKTPTEISKSLPEITPTTISLA